MQRYDLFARYANKWGIFSDFLDILDGLDRYAILEDLEGHPINNKTRNTTGGKQQSYTPHGSTPALSTSRAGRRFYPPNLADAKETADARGEVIVASIRIDRQGFERRVRFLRLAKPA